MANKIISKSSEASNIIKIDVIGKSGRSVSIANGTIRLLYYESILQDTIRATIVFADTGNAIDNKTAVDGLPIVGSEKVSLKFSDNNDQQISIDLYVNDRGPVYDDSNKSLINLDLVSKEFLLNDKVRLTSRFDGKISDYVSDIFSNPKFLGSDKKIDIEPVSNSYNFIGNNWKPFYAVNWLSKRSVSAENQVLGDSAGYFFFETSEGFKFKSIDGLLSQEKKKSIIYNQTPDSRGKNIPQGYDTKAIEYDRSGGLDIQKKLEMGAYSTRTIVFDPFDCYYAVINPISEQKKDSLKLGGKELPSESFNREFAREGKNKEFSRTQYILLDRGSLPSGNTSQQIDKSKDLNFDAVNIMNQSSMRYNQLFASQCTILIPGDFSLHAGDVVFFDAPPQDSEKSDEVNKQTGGLYIISNLCHYISTKETYTKLDLVRDSFGRKGTPSSTSNIS